MAEINLGRVRPVYKGGWSALSSYKYLDWVKYDGSGYIAIKDVPTGTAPVEGGNDHWEIFGSKGQDGLNGVDGQNGPKGDKGDQGIQGEQGEQGEQGPPVSITSDWETNNPTIAFSSSGAYELKQEIDAIGGSGSSGLAGLTSRVEINETDIDALQIFQNATEITLGSITTKNAEQDAEIFDLKNNDATTVQKGLVKRATLTDIEDRIGTGYIASQDLPKVGSLPLGTTLLWTEPFLPEGAIYKDGSLMTGFSTQFVDWYNDYILSGKVQTKPLSEWNDTLVYWNEWYVDTTTGNVRVPKPAPYMTGDGTVDTLGNYVEAGVPNITAEASFGWQSGVSNAISVKATGGAFSADSLQSVFQATSATMSDNSRLLFNASRSSSVYQDGLTTVHTDHTVGRWIVFIYNSSTPASESQSAEFLNALAGKANPDMDNISNTGKSNISGLGMPSTSFEVIAVPAGNTEYITLATGTINILFSGPSNQSMAITDTTTGVRVAERCWSASSNDNRTLLLDVNKGHRVVIFRESGIVSVDCKFYYAQGELD